MTATGKNSEPEKSTSRSVSSMEMPTTISALPVAAPGIMRNNGLNSMHSRKKNAVLRLERPVRLPLSTPAALSAKQLTVVMPNRLPRMVALESTRNTLPKAGKFPSSSSSPALPAMARPVPNVPKKSLISSMMMNGTKLSLRAPRISTWNATLPMDASAPRVKMFSGNTVTPMGIPMIVVRTIEISSAPLIL